MSATYASQQTRDADPEHTSERQRSRSTLAGVQRERGRPLDPATRALMEARFGRDLSDVRVYTSAHAAAAAAMTGAQAFTLGRNIVVGDPAYRPQTRNGRRLIAHELAHVIQQRLGPEGRSAGQEAGESEARNAAGAVARGAIAEVTTGGSGIQRQEPDEETLRRLQGGGGCPSGRCHEQNRGSGGRSLLDQFRTSGMKREDVIRWIEAEGGSAPQPSSASPTPPTGAAKPQPSQPSRAHATPRQPAGRSHRSEADEEPDLPTLIRRDQREKIRRQVESGEAGWRDQLSWYIGGKSALDRGLGPAPPGIRDLPRETRSVPTVEIVATPIEKGGGRAMVVGETSITQSRPDPTAGYNFDTYILNHSSGALIPAQTLGGTRYRVLMGTPKCPGCHFGQGLVVDLHGEHFMAVLAPQVLEGMAIMRGMRAKPPAPSRPTAPRPRTPDDEFREFQQMVREEGGTGHVTAAGEPRSLQPHGAASEARQQLGVTGQEQSAHGLPQSVGKNVPGYDPRTALTTLEERTGHSGMDAYWKSEFKEMRRQGRTTASGREIYDTVSESIQRAPHLSQEAKNTLKLRLQDEMFSELGMQPGTSYPIPYPNVKPR